MGPQEWLELLDMLEPLDMLVPLDTVFGREAQETTAMLLLLPQLVNQFLKPNVSMYQKKNVTPSQNNNVKPSKRKNVLPSQKLAASLNHVKNVFLFQTKLARPYQPRSALNSLPRNVAMSQ